MRRRRHDWPERLADAIRVARGRSFAWGQHDCALFAFDCYAAITGEDLTIPFRGHYTTPLGAARALKRHRGVSTVWDLVASILGPDRSSVLAQRGDMVLLDTELGPTLGVCLGARSAFVGKDGLVYAPTVNAKRSWQV